MATDPPYGVEYDPEWREEAGLGRQRQTGKVANDDRADWTAAYKLFSGDVAYVWHAGVHAGEVATGLVAAGFEIRAQIIWSKQHFAMSRGNYHWQHEPC
jgi:DNA modification methylase